MSLSDVLQREQKEMFAQLANLQSDVRVSYGNDALMPDSTAGLDLLPDTEGFGFIHPESFNQPNTQNEGMCSHTNTELDVSQQSTLFHNCVVLLSTVSAIWTHASLPLNHLHMKHMLL